MDGHGRELVVELARIQAPLGTMRRGVVGPPRSSPELEARGERKKHNWLARMASVGVSGLCINCLVDKKKAELLASRGYLGPQHL